MKTEIITINTAEDLALKDLALRILKMSAEDQAGADRDFQIYGSCVTRMDDTGRRVWVPMKDYFP